MCHVSVGHVARLLEEAGISTVIVGIRAFREQLKAMTPPRVLITRHLMGRTLGAPHDTERQRETILTALDLLHRAEHAGTVLEMTSRYRTVGRES